MASSYRKRWNHLNAGYDAGLDSDIRELIDEEGDYSENGTVAFFKLNYLSENYKRKRFAGSRLDLFKKGSE